MQKIFDQNFQQLNDEEEKNINNDTGKYKIDLLDGNDEDGEDLTINNDDDEEMKEVKHSVQQNRFENMFGLEGEESQISSNLRKSRDFFSKKSSHGIRTSIAGKFLL